MVRDGKGALGECTTEGGEKRGKFIRSSGGTFKRKGRNRLGRYITIINDLVILRRLSYDIY